MGAPEVGRALAYSHSELDRTLRFLHPIYWFPLVMLVPEPQGGRGRAEQEIVESIERRRRNERDVKMERPLKCRQTSCVICSEVRKLFFVVALAV